MLNLKSSIINSKKGFTLIELMIVVAIVAILAAIAIPNFLNYRMKARTSEAKSQIGAINTLEEAYAADTDEYITAAMFPTDNPTSGGYPKTDWTASTLSGIGFALKGKHYYRYGVATGDAPSTKSNGGTLENGTTAADANETDIYVVAEGDLDGDGGATAAKNGRFYATDEDRSIQDANSGEF